MKIKKTSIISRFTVQLRKKKCYTVSSTTIYFCNACSNTNKKSANYHLKTKTLIV